MMIRAKHIVAILITFFAFGSIASAQNGQTKIKLFFGYEKENPNFEDCSKVKAVSRSIPKTPGIATAALNELFKGPNADESAAGFSSFEAESMVGILRSVNVKNGAAYVNFTERLYTQMGNASTSCGGAWFFSMVEKTLRQFPTIKKVYYAVDGDANGFYEWAQVGECPHGRHCRKTNFK